MVLQHSRLVSALAIDCHIAAFSGSEAAGCAPGRLGCLRQQQQRGLPVVQLLPQEIQLPSVTHCTQYDMPVSTQLKVAPPIALLRSRSERLRSVSLLRWSLLVNCFFMTCLLWL